jgi:hypothetical protein
LRKRLASVLNHHGDAFFFKGDKFCFYASGIDGDAEGATATEGILDAWPGMFDGNFDAAILWPTGKAYFFVEDEYFRFDLIAHNTDAGWPKLIKDEWNGFLERGFDRDIDAAIMWPTGKAYFFKGEKYVRYDVRLDKVDRGPKIIKDHWHGFSERGFDRDIEAATIWHTGKAYFFKGEQYVRYDPSKDIGENHIGLEEGYPKLTRVNWPGLGELLGGIFL